MTTESHYLKQNYGITADRDSSYADVVTQTIAETAAPYIAAASPNGLNPDDVREAFQPMHRDNEVFVGSVDTPDGPIPFISSRIRVGAIGDARANRGGTEFTSGAVPKKIAHKATLMAGKQALAETHDAGGKGGIAIAPEYRHSVTDEVEHRLAAAHALLHDINPYNNPTATDISTFAPHMDAMVAALESRFGKHAAAAAAGASPRYGGVPEYSADTTGRGSSIVAEEYLQARARYGDLRVQAALNGSGPALRILQQAAGKAGRPFAENLPKGTELAGLLEWQGGIFSPDEALDPAAILQLARATGLSQEALKAGQIWNDPNDLHAYWRQAADLNAPAYDANQIDVEDVMNSSAFATICIANDPVTRAGVQAANEIAHDVLDGIVTNKGGTLFSHMRAQMLLRGKYRTLDSLKSRWEESMRTSSETIFNTVYSLRAQRGEFVPISEVSAYMVAKDAVHRLHNPIELQRAA